MTMKSDNVHRVISDQPLTLDEWRAEFAPKEIANGAAPANIETKPLPSVLDASGKRNNPPQRSSLCTLPLSRPIPSVP
jgi:hypothetical protein